jgi:hypothetical protein
MTEQDDRITNLRTGLVDGLRAARDAEREVFDALDPVTRDAPAADGGWSAKDVQAHLAAWKWRQVERFAAIREEREERGSTGNETDEINAVLHAERADWTWDRVAVDADAAATALIAEVETASSDTLGIDRISGSVMGNGPEHTLAHLPPIAGPLGLESRVLELADRVAAIVDDGDWPTRPAAFARYNLACFHALGGRLDTARSLLRRALPDEEELRAWAPQDDDLVALRPEIESLAVAR